MTTFKIYNDDKCIHKNIDDDRYRGYPTVNLTSNLQSGITVTSSSFVDDAEPYRIHDGELNSLYYGWRSAEDTYYTTVIPADPPTPLNPLDPDPANSGNPTDNATTSTINSFFSRDVVIKGEWIQTELDSEILVTGIAINVEGCLKSFILAGTNDGGNTLDLITEYCGMEFDLCGSNDGKLHQITFKNEVPFSGYRLIITNLLYGGGSYGTVAAIRELRYLTKTTNKNPNTIYKIEKDKNASEYKI